MTDQISNIPDSIKRRIIDMISPKMGIFITMISHNFRNFYNDNFDECITSYAVCLGNPNTYHFSGVSELEKCIGLSARYGYLDTLKMLFIPKNHIANIISANAASTNKLHILSWCHDNFFPVHSDISVAAARYGQFETLQWLYKKGYEFNLNTIEAALLFGNRKIIDWLSKTVYNVNELIDNYYDDYTEYIFEEIIKENKLESLQWLDDNNIINNINRTNANFFTIAMKNADIPILDWLYAKDFSFSVEDLLYNSIKRINERFFEWCIQKEMIYLVDKILPIAIECSNLHVIKFCSSEIDNIETIITVSFHYIDVSILKLLYIIDKNSIELYIKLSQNNDKNNHRNTIILWIITTIDDGLRLLVRHIELTDIINILIDNNIASDIYLLAEADEWSYTNAHLILQYMKKLNITEVCWDKGIIVRYKAVYFYKYITSDIVHREDMDSLTWLHKNGCPLHEISDEAIECNNVFILDWCLKHDITINFDNCNKSVNVRRWINKMSIGNPKTLFT